MTNATEQQTTVVNPSPLHLTISFPDGKKDFIYLNAEEIKTFNRNKVGWYHLHIPEAVEGEPTPIPTIKSRLSDKECQKYELSHTDPLKPIADQDQSLGLIDDGVKSIPYPDEIQGEAPIPVVEEPTPIPTKDSDIDTAAKEIHNAAMNEEHPLCAESARKGIRQFATHLMTLNATDTDGKHLTEYRHISTIGPKNTYKAIRSI